jgi:hypothetical protein
MLKKDSKNRFFLLILFCCSLLIMCTGCKETKDSKEKKIAFEIDKDFSRGPLTVHVRVDKEKITIADTVLLELEAGIESDYEVKMPKVDKVLENFGIIDWDNLGNKLDKNNNIISTYRYRLEPFLSGTISIPAFSFEFYNVNKPKEEKYELSTEPFDIEVSSLLGQQRAELKIADIEGVVEVTSEPSYAWLWISGGAIVIGGIIFLLFKRRRRTEELVRIFKPAHEIAYERMRLLVEQDMIKAGRIKEFYERISDILRHYIEHRFSFRAPEKTTEEFLADIPTANVLSQPDQERLGDFLQHCDLVKFAQYNPTTKQIQKTFDLAKDFIETTKSDEKKIDVTEINSQKAVEVVSA